MLISKLSTLILSSAVAGGLLLGASGTASATDTWPNRSIKLIVPFTAGGAADTRGANARGLFVRPTIFDEVTPAMRLAREEGIFAGISSGGSLHVATRIAAEVENAVIVTIVCDRGDRYLSTGVFPA